MDTNYNSNANKFFENKEIRNKKKFLSITLCILISLSLWLSIKFSDEYQFPIQIPVSITNIPTDRIQLNEDTIPVVLTVKSKGINALYYHYFGKNEVLRVDYSTLKCKENNKKTLSQFNTSQLLKLFDKHIFFSHEITSLSPDTVTLNFEKTYFKIVPVKLNTQINFDNQYLLYDSIKITPNKIYISGTENVLKDINYISSEPIVFNKLNADQNLYVNLIKPGKEAELKLSVNKIKVNISVEKFTESIINVPINIVKGDNNSKLKLFPNTVKITYLVALKDYKKINKELFEAVVNGNVKKSEDLNKLKVDLIKYPNYIKITKVYPDNVEYIRRQIEQNIRNYTKEDNIRFLLTKEFAQTMIDSAVQNQALAYDIRVGIPILNDMTIHHETEKLFPGVARQTDDLLPSDVADSACFGVDHRLPKGKGEPPDNWQ